jgi:Ca2+-binding RTX toxin-like protein
VRVAAIVGVLAVATLATALAGANTVPVTHAEDVVRSIGPNELKPSACSGIALTATVVGTSGTGANELVLGGPSVDSILAMGGNDCVLGGGGADVIDGGPGNDVCLGGPDLDSFLGCETQVQG